MSDLRSTRVWRDRTIAFVVLVACTLATTRARAAQTPGWNEAKILASSGAESDHFGSSVALSGDRALVGSPNDDDNGSASGSGFLFRYDPAAASWREEAKILASDGGENQQFGVSVALSASVALIGALHDDDHGPFSGAAYLFRYDPASATWSEEAKILASDGAPGDRFGVSVSLSGDRALVGAHRDDDSGEDSGCAYVFRFDPATQSWIDEAKILPSDGEMYDYFGFSVSLDGDRALIGAFGDDDRGTSSGSAYLFRYDRATASWREEAKILASDGQPIDQFGISTSVSGDFALIGAIGDDDQGPLSGSAYVFRHDRATSAWSEEAKILASDGAAYDYFGRSVALTGDRALIGAYGDHGAGSAYLLRDDPATTAWNEETKLLASDGAAGDDFGWSVALSETRVLVGARFDNDLGTHAGSAYILSPYLSASKSSVSSTDGATIDFRLDFPQSEAGMSYAMLGSAAGTGPTVLPGQVSVPLSSDTYFRRSLRGVPPRNFSAAYGVLDANGDSTASWRIIPNGATGWIGQTVWMAAVSWETVGNGPQARLSSQGVALRVLR